MSTPLSPISASYVESMNAFDSDSFIANFAEHAVVRDEGHEYRGTGAIKEWIEDAWKKYRPQFEVADVKIEGAETIISGMVSGTFDGSPLEIHHHLTIENDRIVALKIAA